MPIFPTGLVNRTQLDREITRAIKMLGPDVVRVRYDLTTDHTGDASLEFRIVLTDEASREENLLGVTEAITDLLLDEVRPLEN